MDPRNKKILKKRIKDTDKAIKKGTLKTFPIEGLKDRMYALVEKRKHFPHNFFWWLRKCKIKIADGYYYCKCRIFHPYNVVKVKTLPPTWVDRDLLLLHASFAIFCDVVEKEDILNDKLYDHSEQIAKMKEEEWEDKEDQEKAIRQFEDRHEQDQKYEKELRYLYNWWTVARPERQKRLSGLDYSLEKEEEAYEEDTEHLIRLIKIRGGLWT